MPASDLPRAKTAFVTGGTGFIGSHLVEALLDRGYAEVRCLIRSEPKWLEGLDITPVEGDLGDVELLWEALRDVDYVYHVAGVTRAPTWEAFKQANVTATLNLMGAVKMANPAVKKVLVTSSLAAVGRCDGGLATEETPLRPISRYGKSKAQMEEALADAHQMRQSYMEALPITIVRPPAVYGPREADIYTFFKTVSRGLCPVVGGNSTEPALSLVHVDDLVQGMIAAAEHPDTAGEAYFLGSEALHSWQAIKEATTQALDSWAITLPIPGPLVQALGAVVELGGKLTGQYPPLNREKAREIRYACTMCAIHKARRTFGYRPTVDLEPGIQQTIDWYKANDWL